MRSFLRFAGSDVTRFLVLAVASLFLALPAGALAAGQSAAGTLIRNIAQVTYFDTGLGLRVTLESNAVEARVSMVPALEVTGRETLLLSRGALDQLQFEITNTGNVSLDVIPALTLSGDIGQILDPRLFLDINGNGLVDPQEPQLSAAENLALLAGQRVSLIYSFALAPSARLGDTIDVILSATARPRLAPGLGDAPDITEVSGSGTGRIEVLEATMEIEKSQAVRPGAETTEIRYSLMLRNNSDAAVAGYSEIGGAPLRIDGAVVTGVLLRDEIPLNARFSAITHQGGMMALYHRRGDARHDYTTSAPARAAEIDAVAFFLPGDLAMGRSADPGFAVHVENRLGEVAVENTARGFLPLASGVGEVASNSVSLLLHETLPGELAFIDPRTGAQRAFGSLDSNLVTRLVAGACNRSAEADSLEVTLRSLQTGDVEVTTARETGANSGVFLIAPLPVTEMALARARDGVMASGRGDTIRATARCAGQTLAATLVIAPGNFLFDAISNDPVAGVEVVLTEAASGIVVGRVTSDARGYFAFAEVPAGRYAYAVPDAPAWRFPSVRSDFRGFGRTVTEAGFGGGFEHAGGALVQSDLPLDPVYATPVALEKTADRLRVSQGEFVTYTLKLTNNMRQALVGAEILDRPAHGLTLVPGSVTLNGARLADPRRDRQGDLRFALGTITPLDRLELRYVLAVGAAAREGRLENTALLTGRQAGTGSLMQSAPARAMLRLDNSGGVFARQGTVIGTVFMDCDGDGRQGDWREPGIPGVRLVTQEGLFVVTDRDGQYSLPGLRPVTHAFQLQAATLPEGTGVAVTRTTDLRRGGSRLVPLRRGELRRESFAVTACSATAMAEIEARRAHFDAAAAPGGLRAPDMPLEGLRNPQRSTRTEAGVATTSQLTPARLAAAAGPETAAAAGGEKAAALAPPPLAAKARATRRPLESLIRALDPEPGFLDLAAGEILTRRSQNIRVKGKADLTLGLLLNGRALGADRIGEQSRWAPRNVQAAEFVAVRLRPGENRLTLVGRDGFGIERMRHEITVIAPGDPARIEITVPPQASADPVNGLPVVVRILDRRGLPVPASATVTLGAGRALWDVTDIRPGIPGVQAYIDNGEASFTLIPPQVSGPDRITVTSGFARAEAPVVFTPDLDERILIGVIEGAVSLGGKTRGALLPKEQFSHFEESITGLRGALYLKGAIRGDALLTLRYSSDRDTEDRLFRDIRGDEYYPVYGDGSERGWDAQSSTNLFVKVEKGRSYALYGDIAIQPEAPSLKLGGMRRVATGAKAQWKDDRVSLTFFAARTAQEQRVTEFSGRGVSGPYGLALKGYVEGSERVEILVRDERGGDILRSSALRRGTDYVLDFFRDTITFDDPVRQADFDGNPVSVRVTYEVEEEQAERYWLYGGELRYAASDRTSLGLRAAHADAAIGNPARERLHSAYLRHETPGGGLWEAEIARSEDKDRNSGMAARLSYDIVTATERLSFEAIHTGRAFRAGGLARPGTTQLRLSYGLKIDRKSDLELAAEYIRDRGADSSRTGLEARYSRRFGEGFRGQIGLEMARSDRAGQSDDQAALLLGGHWNPVNRPGVSVRAELRLPLLGAARDPAALTLGMYREAKPGWRVHSEIELSFGDDMLMTRARYGMEYQLNHWLSGSTEFSRAAGALEETWHQGVSAVWQVNDLTTVRADIEHARGAQTGSEALTSLALGAKWHDSSESLVGDADFDATFEESGNTYYASLGMAAQLNDDWTVLGRTRIAIDQRNGADHLRSRSRLGAAYRPIEDARLDVLAWYEHRLEEKHGRSEAHLWSVDASYEASADLRLTGKYAGQRQSISGQGVEATTRTQLLQAGAYVDFADDRFQLGLNATHLWDSRGGSTTGLGAELGFSPAEGTLLAVGYNTVNGRLPGMRGLYQEGAYLRFNLLLDDSLWSRLDGFLGN